MLRNCMQPIADSICGAGTNFLLELSVSILYRNIRGSLTDWKVKHENSHTESTYNSTEGLTREFPRGGRKNSEEE